MFSLSCTDLLLNKPGHKNVEIKGVAIDQSAKGIEGVNVKIMFDVHNEPSRTSKKNPKPTD